MVEFLDQRKSDGLLKRSRANEELDQIRCECFKGKPSSLITIFGFNCSICMHIFIFLRPALGSILNSHEILSYELPLNSHELLYEYVCIFCALTIFLRPALGSILNSYELLYENERIFCALGSITLRHGKPKLRPTGGPPEPRISGSARVPLPPAGCGLLIPRAFFKYFHVTYLHLGSPPHGVENQKTNYGSPPQCGVENQIHEFRALLGSTQLLTTMMSSLDDIIVIILYTQFNHPKYSHVLDEAFQPSISRVHSGYHTRYPNSPLWDNLKLPGSSFKNFRRVQIGKPDRFPHYSHFLGNIQTSSRYYIYSRVHTRYFDYLLIQGKTITQYIGTAPTPNLYHGWET